MARRSSSGGGLVGLIILIIILIIALNLLKSADPSVYAMLMSSWDQFVAWVKGLGHLVPHKA